MKKMLTHLWKYLTSPTYRSYVDLQMTQQALNAHINMMRDQMERAKFPPIVNEIMDVYGIRAEYAIKLAEELKRR